MKPSVEWGFNIPNQDKQTFQRQTLKIETSAMFWHSPTSMNPERCIWQHNTFLGTSIFKIQICIHSRNKSPNKAMETPKQNKGWHAYKSWFQFNYAKLGTN